VTACVTPCLRFCFYNLLVLFFFSPLFFSPFSPPLSTSFLLFFKQYKQYKLLAYLVTARSQSLAVLPDSTHSLAISLNILLGSIPPLHPSPQFSSHSPNTHTHPPITHKHSQPHTNLPTHTPYSCLLVSLRHFHFPSNPNC